MSAELIELARFPTSEEASIVRGKLEAEGIRTQLSGEAVAGWLWHFGSAVGGVRLFISEADVRRAHEILDSVRTIDESEYFGEMPADDSDAYEEELPDDLIRAWRASLIGLFLLPPLLNLYSTWLLVRNGFFRNQCHDWRVVTASSVNLFVFAIVAWFALMIAASSQNSQPRGQPLSIERTITIPIVPTD